MAMSSMFGIQQHLEAANRLETILQCGICLELFKDPRILTCGHVFCELCLRRMLGVSGRTIKCPACQQSCAVSQVINGFMIKELVDVQKNMTAVNSMVDESTGARVACELCEKENDFEHLWSCHGCESKMTCSKCMVKTGHGSKCAATPQNLAEIFANKKSTILEWRQTVCEPHFITYNARLALFAQRIESMLQWMPVLRDLLKNELIGQYGEAKMVQLRSEFSNIYDTIGPLVAMTKGELPMDRRILTCDEDMARLSQRLATLTNEIDGSVQKFGLCFEALNGMFATFRRIMNDEPELQMISPLQPEVASTVTFEMTPSSEPPASPEAVIAAVAIPTTAPISSDDDSTVTELVQLLVLTDNDSVPSDAVSKPVGVDGGNGVETSEGAAGQ